MCFCRSTGTYIFTQSAVRNVREEKWENLGQSLGSDHFILETSMDDACGRWERKHRACKLTDWHKWREARERRLGEQAVPNIVDIKLWTRELLLEVEHHARKIEAPDGVPDVDSHLLHIWDARESLTKRWRRQPLNRKLRRRVAELSK